MDLNTTKSNLYLRPPDSNNDINSWFLMGSPAPLLLIMAAYWLFVLKIGPSLMNKRSPFTLRNVLAVYNVLQVLLSFYILWIGSAFLWTNGIIQTECMDNFGLKQVGSGVYVYFLAKMTELLDTVFFILRKKYNQASFLHVYHHSVTAISTWTVLKYEPNVNAITFLGTLNSFVHVVMYTYYALSAYPQLAKYLWWKKYITKLQLVQFVVALTHMVIEYKVTKCKQSNIFLGIISFNLVLFLYLFSNFYQKTYNENEPAIGITRTTENKAD